MFIFWVTHKKLNIPCTSKLFRLRDTYFA